MTESKNGITPREAALLSLCKCADEGKYSNLELDSTIKKCGFSGADKSLYTTLLYGVIEKKITLDYYIGLLSSIEIGRIEKKVLNILRLGLYQILYLERIPDRAAVSESVELCKLHSHKGADGFVNAVLRNAIRKRDTLLPPSEAEVGSAKHLSVKYSLPEWLCTLWSESYGRENAEKIMNCFSDPPYITLRTNTLKITREDLILDLGKNGIPAKSSAISQTAAILTEYTSISELRPLVNGLCFVQDEASQLCAEAVGCKSGDTVIDVCSCPGGKSFGMAMFMENSGRLISLDLHESKLSLVSGGAEKLGVTILETAAHNGSRPIEELIGKADRVLCDVPCSGLGVIAKKPDLRHKSPDDIAKLPEIQYSILDASSNYVKSGGVLVYSTCTLNPAENEQVTERFLREHSDFQPEKLGVFPDEPEICRKTLFPFEFGTDGFYMAKFRKQ